MRPPGFETVTSRSATATSRSLAILIGLVVSLRPHQWIKNLLVFSGLIFSGNLLAVDLLTASLHAFTTFCLISSSIYLLNDLRDLQADRKHPVKRWRPIAAMVVPESMAWATLLLMWLASAVSVLRLPRSFTLTVFVYLLLNIAYSVRLKHVVILDMMIVASGFVLRAVAGAFVIGVQPSPWLVLCTMLLALLVVSGKRCHDVALLRQHASQAAPKAEWYTAEFLSMVMGITGGGAVVTYALYTLAEETVRRVGSQGLILTVPFVLYGVLRYLFLVHQRVREERADATDPAFLFVTDLPTMLNVLGWVLTSCLVLYNF
jgi:4-hydroxybenzoate polyprenyltransferase